MLHSELKSLVLSKCSKQTVKVKTGGRPLRWPAIINQLLIAVPLTSNSPAAARCSAGWRQSWDLQGPGSSWGPRQPQLSRCFPGQPPAFLLSWQNLHPVALGKSQEKGQWQVIVLQMKTNESSSVVLLASCRRKQSTML